jgi:hypothetical protein
MGGSMENTDIMLDEFLHKRTKRQLDSDICAIDKVLGLYQGGMTKSIRTWFESTQEPLRGQLLQDLPVHVANIQVFTLSDAVRGVLWANN